VKIPVLSSFISFSSQFLWGHSLHNRYTSLQTACQNIGNSKKYFPSRK